MSQIRVVYHGHEPNFPATDQHPDASRFYVYADGSIVPVTTTVPAADLIPQSANTALSEEERQRLAALEGQRARAEKDRRAQEWVGAKPVYVVDAIGEPTLDEIEEMLGG